MGLCVKMLVCWSAPSIAVVNGPTPLAVLALDDSPGNSEGLETVAGRFRYSGWFVGGV